MVSWFGNTVVATANFRRLPTEARLHFATNGRGYVSLTPTGDQVSLDLDVLLGQDSPPVHAIAGTGYEFANWTCAGHFISTANPLVVPAVSEDLFIWANFVPAGGGMTLTLVPEPAAGGTVAPAAPVTGIAPEQAVPIQAFAAAGYRFDHWSAAPATATFGSSTAAGTTVTLAETAVVTAHFAPLPVTAAFATAASTTAENAGARPIEVVLGSPSVGTVTVNYGVLGGTATAGEDFLLAPGPLTFLPGETRQSLLLTPLGDGVAEGNETVMLRLTTMVNATMGTPGMHSVTITDSPGWLSVVFLAGPHGSLRGMPVQTVPQGGDTTPVEAVGDDGYEFDRWDDHSPECRDNPRVVRNVTVRTSLTALFRPVVATVAPDGSFEATADARMAADGGGIWDLTGTYAASVKGSLVVLSLVHGTTGKLSGAASYTMAKDTTVSMPVKGSVKGASGSITMKGTLKGTAPDKTVSVALTLNLTVDTANRRLTGPLTGSVKSGGVTTAVNQDLALDLPAGMDGTWTLTLHLAQAGTAVGGTALLTLANGADYAFSVKGKTGPANAAVLTLTGDRADPAAKALKLKAGIVPLADGTARIESLAGKAYGQAITW
jgi:hypothetical protein